uniref:Uncharacterized protein n=1 Tax=Knipowitschia caucasica TaxID=637954 RepID=A0AAV2KHL3_KNICA
MRQMLSFVLLFTYLTIFSENSGIYHCAATSAQDTGTQYVAGGTTLVVQEPVKIMVRHILLWLFCVLLAIYNLALVSLIVIKKGLCLQICRKNTSAERTLTKRVQFHDVLQELYKRRGLKTNTQAATGFHNKMADTSSNSLHNDIYQNM